MTKIIINTDIDLNESFVKNYDVDTIPYTISINGNQFNSDWDSIDTNLFFENWEKGLVKPSQYPLGNSLSIIDKYDEVILLTANKHLTAGYPTGYTLKNIRNDKNIEIVSTNTLGSGLRLLAEDFLEGKYNNSKYQTFWFVPSSFGLTGSGRIKNPTNGGCSLVTHTDDSLVVISKDDEIYNLFSQIDVSNIEEYNISYSRDLLTKERKSIKAEIQKKMGNISFRNEGEICPTIATVSGPKSFSIGVKYKS